jgi:SOS-response transcriptional repressor LexA
MTSTRLRVKELLRQRRWTTKVLAEKTGMSESYLTHIKNGTRRWNEDALKKLADAFELEPIDLFEHRKSRVEAAAAAEKLAEQPQEVVEQKTKLVPVMGEIPSNPSPYNNQLAQVTTGYKDVFVPVFGSDDESIFCFCIEDNAMAPNFVKGDYLLISPAVWTRSGDIVAVEYGNGTPTKAILQVSYMDDFIVLESINHKRTPIALVRGKDHFRIIGKVVYRYQKMA